MKKTFKLEATEEIKREGKKISVPEKEGSKLIIRKGVPTFRKN